MQKGLGRRPRKLCEGFASVVTKRGRAGGRGTPPPSSRECRRVTPGHGSARCRRSRRRSRPTSERARRTPWACRARGWSSRSMRVRDPPPQTAPQVGPPGQRRAQTPPQTPAARGRRCCSQSRKRGGKRNWRRRDHRRRRRRRCRHFLPFQPSRQRLQRRNRLRQRGAPAPASQLACGTGRPRLRSPTCRTLRRGRTQPARRR
mmetsp:Transcript_44368/g.144006  ORF Transcript_44368/g.144006 Transcript_44368/m.144006 type:complete len:203 (+) Transcript_44368:225-833(+)